MRLVEYIIVVVLPHSLGTMRIQGLVRDVLVYVNDIHFWDVLLDVLWYAGVVVYDICDVYRRKRITALMAPLVYTHNKLYKGYDFLVVDAENDRRSHAIVITRNHLVPMPQHVKPVLVYRGYALCIVWDVELPLLCHKLLKNARLVRIRYGCN